MEDSHSVAERGGMRARARLSVTHRYRRAGAGALALAVLWAVSAFAFDGRAEPVSDGTGAYPWRSPAATYRPLVFSATDRRARLELYIGDAWSKVCEAPCAVSVWVGGTYRVGGRGVTNSRTFIVAPGTHPIDLEAKTGSASQHGFGIASMSAGGAAMVLGFIMLDVYQYGTHQEEDTLVEGASLLGVGTIAVLAGAVLLVTSGTKISVRNGPALGTLRIGRGFELSSEGIRF